jgi:hypothetical protein
MDPSKLPGITKKSSETPWTSDNEQRKLSDRAGTVVKNKAKLVNPVERSWAPTEDRAKPKHRKAWPKDKSNIAHGKDPDTGKPVHRSKLFGLPTSPTANRLKNKKDEREY